MLPWEDYRTAQPFDLVKLDMRLISFHHFDKLLSAPQMILLLTNPVPHFHTYRWCRIGVETDDWTKALASEDPRRVQMTRNWLQQPIARYFAHFFVMNLTIHWRMQRAVRVIERHWQRKKALDVIRPALKAVGHKTNAYVLSSRG